jgi:hypothetical protein
LIGTALVDLAFDSGRVSTVDVVSFTSLSLHQSLALFGAWTFYGSHDLLES